MYFTEKKKRAEIALLGAVWSSVTQPSMEPHFGATFQGRAVSKPKNVRFGSHFIRNAIFGLPLTNGLFWFKISYNLYFKF